MKMGVHNFLRGQYTPLRGYNTYRLEHKAGNIRFFQTTRCSKVVPPSFSIHGWFYFELENYPSQQHNDLKVWMDVRPFIAR